MARNHRIVIVGAAIAGLTAAETLRAEGFSGDITLVGEEAHLPYSRPPLSKQVLLDDWSADKTTIKSLEELNELGINFLSKTRAIKLNLNEKIIITNFGTGVLFDALIIATGTMPRKVTLDGGIPTLRTIDDSISLRSQMQKAKRIAVLGSGVLGSEIASAAVSLGSTVALIGRSSNLSFGAVGVALSSRIEKLHLDNGVDLRLRRTLTQIASVDNQKRLIFSDGEELTTDFIVAAIGGYPTTDWLKDSGLAIDDGVICDSNGEAAPGVYAIGDVAAWPDSVTGLPRRIEHQSNAIEQAIAVAQRIMNDSIPKTPVPFFWSEIHGARIKAYGWFDSEPLAVLQQSPSTGELLASGGAEAVSGIVAWNLPPKEFLKARLLVENSLAKE